MPHPRWRRRRIITGGFQYSLLAISFGYFVVILVAFSTVLFGPLVASLNDSTLSPEARADAATQFLTLHGRIWPPMLLILALLGLHSVFVSHRIAGPLYRIRQVLGEVAKGDLTVRAVLRNGDYLVSDADVLNRTIGELESRIEQIQQAHHGLLEVVREMELDGSARGVMRSSVATLQQRLQELNEGLDHLKTSSKMAEPATLARRRQAEAGQAGDE